jgi:hypothetical protein
MIALNFLTDSPTHVSIHGIDHLKQYEMFWLFCNVTDGNPTNYTYLWSFEPKYKYSNIDNSVNRATKYLNIQSITRVQAGEYKCTATNLGGSTSSAVHPVTVQCRFFSKTKPLYMFIIILFAFNSI